MIRKKSIPNLQSVPGSVYTSDYAFCQRLDQTVTDLPDNPTPPDRSAAKAEEVSDAKNPVRAAIMMLVREAGPDTTIDPCDAARAVSPQHWNKLLKDIRAEAVRLAQSGEITIYRKGKPVDPNDFKGVYRLGLSR
ncbi:MAG: hypothetical protein CME88_05040 [Hirschia sp.]|nr:hypothetical protein [Hirschia sp.]MBF17728.1 hypothetical protein [Hirschia sp.]